MVSVPPPQGMSEVDYETIEAAVTETVRGRWFLSEFARRNRTNEMNQLLEAMGRLEHVVASGQPALPAADPSIRLLMQRIKEIACQLDVLSGDMRSAGVDERFASAVEKEARAVAGMLRGPARPLNASSKLEPPRLDATQQSASQLPVPEQLVSELPVSEPQLSEQPILEQSVPEQLVSGKPAPEQPAQQQHDVPSPDVSRRSAASYSSPLERAQARARAALGGAVVSDPRLAALSRLDALPLAEKLTVFS